MKTRETKSSNRQLLAWQGWRLELPARWNPVKIEGNYDAGSVLIADLHRPRLGIRWRTASQRKFDAAKWAQKAMHDEVGLLAAEEARPFEMSGTDQWEASTLFIEPDPPGRDVWVAVSKVSSRCIEVVHHAHRRESILAESVLPGLSDSPPDEPTPWSIFDLSCVCPAGMKLTSHRLNAGDLGLTFESKRRLLVVRQIALAQMALKRMSLEKWLANQEERRRKHFRPAKVKEEITVKTADGREMVGISRRMVRRRRYFLLRSLPVELFGAVLHDCDRDRLVIVQASDQELLHESGRRVGTRLAAS